MATVQDLLIPLLKRLNTEQLTGSTVFHALNEATAIIFEHLWMRDSDLATEQFSVRFAANRPLAMLPEGFRGLKGRPFVDGETSRLMPATEDVILAAREQPGVPSHYALAGEELEVFPTPTVATVVRGRCYIHPADITLVTTAMPFHDVFNRVFREAIYRVCKDGPGVTSDRSFAEFLTSSVDDLLSVRDRHEPIRRKVRDF